MVHLHATLEDSLRMEAAQGMGILGFSGWFTSMLRLRTRSAWRRHREFLHATGDVGSNSCLIRQFDKIDGALAYPCDFTKIPLEFSGSSQVPE